MFVYTPAAFVMFPRPLLTLLTVIAFGPWLGFVYGMAGILGAAAATYYAGRQLRRETVHRLAGDHLEPLTKALRRHGLVAMLTIRILPAAPFVVEGVVAGALRVKLWHYTLGTFLGMLPGVLATTVFGDQIAAALEDPSKMSYWLAGGALAILAVTMFFLRRWATKHHQI
jgi:phospholipase D1/2